MLHTAGLLTYCSFVQPSHLIGSDLDSEQTILQITAAGLCQNLTGFPKTECGCKGTTKFADVQILSGKSDCDKYLNKKYGLGEPYKNK